MGPKKRERDLILGGVVFVSIVLWCYDSVVVVVGFLARSTYVPQETPMFATKKKMVVVEEKVGKLILSSIFYFRFLKTRSRLL